MGGRGGRGGGRWKLGERGGGCAARLLRWQLAQLRLAQHTGRARRRARCARRRISRGDCRSVGVRERRGALGPLRHHEQAKDRGEPCMAARPTLRRARGRRGGERLGPDLPTLD